MIYIFGGAFDPPHAGHSAIIRTLLHFRHPTQIVILPSGKRNDKEYGVSDEHRLQMLRIFCDEINGNKNTEQILTEGQKEDRVIIDDYFIREWEGEMITRDVDEYARRKYGEDIVHIFGTDTISSMPDWDSEQYAARKIQKIFVPRSLSHCEGNKAIQKKNNDPVSGLDRHASLAMTEQVNFSHCEVRSNPDSLKKSIDCHVDFSQEQKNLLAMTEQKGIENFEFFTESHIPDISSTDIRASIPEYATIHARYENDPQFMIPGLSKKISQYILQKKLYLPKQEIKPKILVHVCCGPDVTMPILELRDAYDVICFWYDPNIQPKAEYDKRYDAFVRVCEIENIPYIKGAYDVKNFFHRIRGLEDTPEKGEKCTHCYDMRMYVAAKLAKKLSIPLYTSSLNTSPKKDLEKLFQMGHKYAEKYGIEFLDIPFRKLGGFEKSVEYTTKNDIYRQNYCGCVYSIRDGGGGG